MSLLKGFRAAAWLALAISLAAPQAAWADDLGSDEGLPAAAPGRRPAPGPAPEAPSAVGRAVEPGAPIAEPAPPVSAPAKSGKLSLLDAAPALSPISDYRGDLWSRNALLGDLDGRRQDLYEKGIALDFQLSQLPQGVVSGGRDEEWRYSGFADYYLTLDSGRLDLWPGGLFVLHAKTKFGRSVNSQAGSLMPVNFAYLTPSADESDQTFLEEYYITQALSEKVVLYAGRLLFGNIGDTNRFANNERTQFTNTALRNSPLLGILSAAQSIHGAAVQYQATPNLAISVAGLSNNDEDNEYGSPGGLFSEYTVAVQPTVNWKIGDLPGTLLPIGGYTSNDAVELDNSFLLRDALTGRPIPSKSGNWAVGFSFDQYLYMPEPSQGAAMHTAEFDKQPEGIGVFFRYHYSPEDRNPWNQFVSGGIGGRGVIPGRPNDRYGLGFYALLESNDLKDQPLLGRVLDTEWGMEAFYNVALTPWLQISPHIQYIQPGLPTADESVVVGTRIQLYF